MTWFDLMTELEKTSPDTFGLTHVEVNPNYKRIDGRVVRVSVDNDSFIFEFTGKYKSKYKTTVRIWSNSRVTASIELENNTYFDYPITNEDEHFDNRMDLYGPSAVKNNLAARTEIKEIYDWTFNAYHNLL